MKIETLTPKPATSANPKASAELRSKELLAGHRVELRVDGKLRVGFSVDKDLQTSEQTIALLEEAIAMLKAPRTPVPQNF